MTSPSEAAAFLNALFEHRPAGAIVIGVQLPSGRTRGYASPDPLAELASGARELYVCATAMLGSPRRCQRLAKNAVFVPGAWADVDINGSPVRGSEEVVTGHAPDRWAAAETIYALAEPTMVVSSGYGLQPWWLLERGLVLHDRDEQEHAHRLVEGVQRALAHAGGFRVDATADLSRILRIPGTLNTKAATPAPVRLLLSGGPRYTLEQLAAIAGEYAPAPADGPVTAKPVEYYAGLIRDGTAVGDRHDRVWELTGHLLARGIDPLEAWEVVRCWNEARIKPPYDDDTLFKRFREIARKHADEQRAAFAAAWEAA